MQITYIERSLTVQAIERLPPKTFYKLFYYIYSLFIILLAYRYILFINSYMFPITVLYMVEVTQDRGLI